MELAAINDTELAYEVRGSGEAVLLMHCGFVGEGFRPLLDQAGLTESYHLINYHRRGYGGSRKPNGPVSMEQQAADGLALLDFLKVERVHLVGHSLGANIALQVALMAPDRLISLSLLEPTLTFALSPTSLPIIMADIGKSMALYGAGDRAGAVDNWLRGAFGPGYRETLDQALPGVFEQAVADCDTIFQVEGPALQEWQFGPGDLSHIRVPVLSVFHIDPNWSGFQETHEALLQGLPQAETLVVPNATHLLQIQNPRSVAEGLATFFARHPSLTPAN